MNTVTELSENLKKVLKLFLLPNYTIDSITYLDILLSHIERNFSDQLYVNSDVDKKVLQKWLLEALNTWTKDKMPCQAVITFTLNLVGIIGQNEFDFLYWYRDNVVTKLCRIFDLRDDHLQVPVKMAYIAMLLKFLNHPSGRQWILETGIWKDVIKLCHSNHLLYVSRESQKFMWKLLHLECENRMFCEEVILMIAEPLMKNELSPQVYSTTEDNYFEQDELLLSSINLLTVIMENTLFASKDNTIPQLLNTVTNLESRIQGLFETCISTKFFEHIIKLMYIFLFMKLKEGIVGLNGCISSEVWKVFWSNLRYIDSMLLAKKHIMDLIKGGKLMLIYWQKIISLCEIKLPNQYKFEVHTIIVMIMPLCVCMEPKDLNEDNILEIFVQKILSITSVYTQRLCYLIRGVMMKEDLPTEYICKSSIEISLDVLDIIDRECAVIIFQIMSYALKNYVPPSNNEVCSFNFVSVPSVKEAKKENENPRIPIYKGLFHDDPVVQCPHLLSALLNALATVINKYKLKWQECLETINILSVTQDIVNHPNVIPKVCVSALILCKLAIQNFMAPNLVLLVPSDGAMNEIGPVLLKRMHDPNWEVRDSVLDVVNTIAMIAEDKYPAFQDLLLENEFPQLIVNIATMDNENYVRAIALTCISSFIRIDRIWDEKLCHLDLLKMAIELMTNESEANVRREAVILVKELYVHRKWSKSTVKEITKVMSAVAVLDLDWEVKINALQFWKQFIKSHFSDQGMLDGTFPKVTFSKEHKKIVVLDEDEIRKRILKALDELASQNCLGVLLATLEDESDFQVCKTSAEIINKFKEVFVTYKVNESTVNIFNNEDVAIDYEILSTNDNKVSLFDCNDPVEFEACSTSTDIIDSNMDFNMVLSDMNLLFSVYKNPTSINPNIELKNCSKFERISNVKKEEFLRSVFSYNLDSYIEEKNRWLKTYSDSLSSILDDILVAHEKKNVNEMDCY